MTGLPREVRLSRLADQLGDRDRQLLADVVAHRLMSGGQLRRLFFWNYPHQATGTRRAQATLTRLTRLGVLQRPQRQVGGVRAGSQGYLYEASPEGQRVAALLDTGNTAPLRLRTTRHPGHSFVAHTLLASELYVRLIEAERAEQLELTAYQSEPACWRPFTGPLAAPETLKPDAFLVASGAGGEQWSFVEVDRGTEGTTALLRKCEVYVRYWHAGVEQARHGQFPRVVWLVDRPARLQVLEDVFSRTTQPDLFIVGLFEDAVSLLSTGTSGASR